MSGSNEVVIAIFIINNRNPCADMIMIMNIYIYIDNYPYVANTTQGSTVIGRAARYHYCGTGPTPRGARAPLGLDPPPITHPSVLQLAT